MTRHVICDGCGEPFKPKAIPIHLWQAGGKIDHDFHDLRCLSHWLDRELSITRPPMPVRQSLWNRLLYGPYKP